MPGSGEACSTAADYQHWHCTGSPEPARDRCWCSQLHGDWGSPGGPVGIPGLAIYLAAGSPQQFAALFLVPLEPVLGFVGDTQAPCCRPGPALCSFPAMSLCGWGGGVPRAAITDCSTVQLWDRHHGIRHFSHDLQSAVAEGFVPVSWHSGPWCSLPSWNCVAVMKFLPLSASTHFHFTAGGSVCLGAALPRSLHFCGSIACLCPCLGLLLLNVFLVKSSCSIQERGCG